MDNVFKIKNDKFAEPVLLLWVLEKSWEEWHVVICNFALRYAFDKDTR